MPFGRFWSSTIGKKVVMAVTGIVLVGYILAHVTANLLIFAGAAAIDAYAAKLRTLPILLWGVRVVLLLSVVLHVVAAAQLAVRARAARPTSYRRFEPQASSASSRTMRWGGVALLLFLVYHILHFTTGQAHPAFVHLAPYHNVTTAFRVWWVAAIYIAAMVALAMHLYHGTWSMFQTLGIQHARVNVARRRLATIIAVLVPLGFVSVPIAVLVGLLR
ncbi:MAG TPA: succinate dehydrogenase cytochrome b subunit [Gemmatimonadaceae bacterium]|nr:succinate dehydrogenase cytochrome b subunit [Gemmatimonadaceae bacterium]